MADLPIPWGTWILGATLHEKAEEACDGVDDDCDGPTDEGYADDNDNGIADCIEEEEGSFDIAGGGCRCDAVGSGAAWLVLIGTLMVRRRRKRR